MSLFRPTTAAQCLCRLAARLERRRTFSSSAAFAAAEVKKLGVVGAGQMVTYSLIWPSQKYTH